MFTNVLMVVYVLDVPPENLRGELCRWLLEVKPCVFVGKISKPVRDKLWSRVRECFMQGGLTIYKVPTEQGYHFEMFGSPYRKVVDFNGVELISIEKRKK